MTTQIVLTAMQRSLLDTCFHLLAASAGPVVDDVLDRRTASTSPSPDSCPLRAASDDRPPATASAISSWTRKVRTAFGRNRDSNTRPRYSCVMPRCRPWPTASMTVTPTCPVASSTASMTVSIRSRITTASTFTIASSFRSGLERLDHKKEAPGASNSLLLRPRCLVAPRRGARPAGDGTRKSAGAIEPERLGLRPGRLRRESTRCASSTPSPSRASTSGRRGRVDREHHQRLAALAVARDGHVRDVDAGLAEQRADAADHARDVVVAEEDHPRRELDLDLEAERRDEPLPVLAADRRARDRDLAGGDGDQVREVARRRGVAPRPPRSRARRRSAAALT